MFGISKSAYYKRQKTDNVTSKNNQTILKMVQEIRQTHPRAGTRKLMHYLLPNLANNNIKIGRDALFSLLRNHALLVKKTKRFHITTDSKHFFKKSPNRLKNIVLMHCEQAVVSDITYLKTDQGHAYLALVTDPFSKKIMGYAIEQNMKVEMVKAALKMAHKNLQFHHDSVIHHSDRGIQYCCPDYSDFAQQLGFVLSTTQQYDPYENAVAERINGILKCEYGLRHTLPDLEAAKKMVKQAVDIYNNQRIHWSLGLKTPESVHQNYDQQPYKSYAKKNNRA